MNPATSPPGRAEAGDDRLPTGSDTPANRSVSRGFRRSAAVAGVVPDRITSGLRGNNSFGNTAGARRCQRPSHSRYGCRDPRPNPAHRAARGTPHTKSVHPRIGRANAVSERIRRTRRPAQRTQGATRDRPAAEKCDDSRGLICCPRDLDRTSYRLTVALWAGSSVVERATSGAWPMSQLGQSLPMRTPLASYQVRNSLKADLVKRHTRSHTIERNLSLLTRFRPLTLIRQNSCSLSAVFFC